VHGGMLYIETGFRWYVIYRNRI